MTALLLSLTLVLGVLGNELAPDAPPPLARVSAPPIEPVPFTAVRFTGGLLGERLTSHRERLLPAVLDQCEASGRLDNFAIAGGLRMGDFRGICYDDSDVYKAIEGACYALAAAPDAALEARVESIVSAIAAAQEADGYLYTIRQIRGDGAPGAGPSRWSNLAHGHELYNLGHLIEAAVAHWRATGRRTLLDVALRAADLVDRTFGPHGERRGVPGHEELELALVKLADATGDARWSDLARWLLEQRGRADERALFGDYAQDHAPVGEQREAVGHAVRAGYLYAAMTDVVARGEHDDWLPTLDALWRDVVGGKTYLTGGVGAKADGEAFGAPFELPNDSAYAETCAAVAQMLWNERLFRLSGEGAYVDVLEQTLYNGFLAGVSLSGDSFHYVNPLAWDGRTPYNVGVPGRSPWFSCSCCPVNVARVLPALPGWAYATRGDALYVNLYARGEARVVLGGGDGDGAGALVSVEQHTDYPWDGHVRVVLRPAAPRVFTLRLRIPGWTGDAPLPGGPYAFAHDAVPAPTLRLDGDDELLPLHVEQGYAVIRRRWEPGDAITLHLPMPVRRVHADPRVAADSGRVALQRGPIVYCVEGVDADGSVADLRLPPTARVVARLQPDLLGGAVALRLDAERALPGREQSAPDAAPTAFGDARAGDVATPRVNGNAEAGDAAASRVTGDDDSTDALTLSGKRESARLAPVAVRAVPYALWGHRGAGEMAVWLAERADLARPVPPPPFAARAKADASHCWAGDTVLALNDGLLPERSSDQGPPRLTFWDHVGRDAHDDPDEEWIAYTFEQPVDVAGVALYWFDDTGAGRCRIPVSWRLRYRPADPADLARAAAVGVPADDGWLPIPGVVPRPGAGDRFDALTFAPRRVRALRVDVVLRPGFSAGVLEWQVLPAVRGPAASDDPTAGAAATTGHDPVADDDETRAAHAAAAARWHPAPAPLSTRWAADVDPAAPLPEYPRPTLVRKLGWRNLNGLWSYAITPRRELLPARRDGEILVPFPIESSLSGVGRALGPDERLWYTRLFTLPEAWDDGRVLLHFGAVDHEAEVWLDGQRLGAHEGGFDPFSFDLTDALGRRGSPRIHELVVAVWDPTDTGGQPRGKQVLEPGGIFYTPSSGIWQTVWLERVPEVWVRDLVVDGDPHTGRVTVRADVSGWQPGDALELWVRTDVEEASTARSDTREVTLVVPDPRPWTPEHPVLYDLSLRVLRGERVLDAVTSYVGLRSVSLLRDTDGVLRMALNGEPRFQLGLLDQGFWPDGLYTAPTDEALRSDIALTKHLGFDMARKHVKLEPERWYSWCDRMGLLVWQDMPSGGPAIGPGDDDAEPGVMAERDFEHALERLVASRRNHPSIVTWVLFNEGWGQHDTEALSAHLAALDPTRLVDAVSGWADRGTGDLIDAHVYTGPGMPPADDRRARVLGEFGGLGLPVEGHTWQAEGWGYQGHADRDALTDAYVQHVEALRPLIAQGLCAAVYTQTTDVESEVNGVVTYDRAVVKLDEVRVRAANRRARGPAPRVHPLLPLGADAREAATATGGAGTGTRESGDATAAVEADARAPVVDAADATAYDAIVNWRYVITPPGEGWQLPAFDDGAWSSGPGGFGTPVTPGARIGTLWDGSDLWVRRAFTIDGPLPAGTPTLLVHHDEDLELFLDGAPLATLPGYTTDVVLVPLGEALRASLGPGPHLLAAHVRQTRGGQYLDLGLVTVQEMSTAGR